ncbi:phage tail tube protein [Methylobacterium sp. Leaf106]|uniref:phage tail tube protein n=1 Tax=Methylobacterium sp. Leaf106 TaxID=1736255 RepID=UPI0006FF2FF2|nr:phage tail tube protein [Methylobacterium sp. Leaf106]KQP53002.1 phage tail protein [Methylobacterium sp. Leaf106]
MTIAIGSSRRIAYVAEATYGVTPATPSFKTFRSTGGGPRTNKTTGTSDEIQSDRNIRDEFQLGQDVSGAYNFELSYGSLDDMLEGALFGTWTTNVLKNGTDVKSFSFEETINIGGAARSYSRFTGAMVSMLSLAITARAAITGSATIMAQKELLDTAIVTGSTYAASGATPISTASANVANLTVSGLTNPAKVRSLTLEVNNNLRTRPVVGNLYTDSFGYGMCEVTGTLECYFETNELYQKVLDHGSAALTFTVGNATNQKYTFLLPKIILGNGERRPGGNSDDVMVSIPYRAVLDATTGASLQITRGVA